MTDASTLLSSAIALGVALLLGPLLSRTAAQWFSGRGLTNLLVELRGALLPFLGAPLLIEGVGLPAIVAAGLIVGTAQGIAIARWSARRGSTWSPHLLGAVALGRSGAAVLTAHALSRGAIVATLATTVVQVILVEAWMTCLGLAPASGGTIGGRLVEGARFATPFLLLAAVSLTFLLELLASWLFQRRSR